VPGCDVNGGVHGDEDQPEHEEHVELLQQGHVADSPQNETISLRAFSEVEKIREIHKRRIHC
jgi:hypothetical protein